MMYVASANTAIIPNTQNFAQSLLRSGRALILVDGVDEIGNDARAQLRAELHQLVQLAPNCTIIVTTRPRGVPDGWLAEFEFREVRIVPMTAADREEFVDAWHRAVDVELKRLGRPDASLRNTADALKQGLRDHPMVGRLATNPLLAAMICALHRERNRKLPETLHELAEALCLMLLHQRERQSGMDVTQFPKAYADLTYDQKKSLVTDLAEQLVTSGAPVITVAKAKRILARGLKETPGRKASEWEIILQQLIERSGMLREAEPGQIDFVHNTFRDYLASSRLVRREAIDELVSHIDDERWEGVLMFAAAAPDEFEFVTDLLCEVLRSFEARPSRTRRVAGSTTVSEAFNGP